MKKNILSITTMAIFLLTSCTNTKLRSDIAKFIASFSLNDAVKAYLEAGYTSTKIESKNGKETKEVEQFDFDVRDVNMPHYSKKITTYSGDQISKEVEEHIEYKNEKFYFVKTGEAEVEYTLQQCHDLVEKFFYKTTMFDGSYHAQGMYYGDYIAQSAEYFQNYITIDQERNLYIFVTDKVNVADGKNQRAYEKYEVNSLGMLDNLTTLMIDGEDSIKQEIFVYRK